MEHHTRIKTRTRTRHVIPCLVLILLILIGLTIPGLHQDQSSSAYAKDDDDTDYGTLPSEIAVTIRPEPSILVTRGEIITYTIRLKNDSSADADYIQVTLPFDPAQLTLLDVHFTQETDWVTARKQDRITLMFRNLERGKVITADVSLRVANDLPNGTVINMWARYQWGDGTSGENDKMSNAAPLVVADSPVSAPWTWMVVDPPRGTAQSQFGFFSDRFLPQEPVVFWLNTPDGPRAMDKIGTVDLNGRLWFDYGAAGLQPGSYQMVAYGKRSEIIAVVTFIVDP